MYAAIGANSPYCWPDEEGVVGEGMMLPGEGSQVYDMDFGRIGVLTCYDGYFFPSFEVPSLKGAEVLVWVNSRAGAIEEHIVKAASFMTCTHVIASNQAVGAGSMVCAYPANILGIAPKGEAFITGTLNLSELRIQRKNNRMLHQRRPEILKDLGKSWNPWDAYPEIPFFAYPEKGKE